MHLNNTYGFRVANTGSYMNEQLNYQVCIIVPVVKNISIFEAMNLTILNG